MKNFLCFLVLSITISFSTPYIGQCQDQYNEHISLEINKVYPSLSISSKQLKEARLLIDLNDRYESDWVEKYISVSISAWQNGIIKQEKSYDDKLTPAQKKLMDLADLGSKISVLVSYLPKNNLSQNDPKEIRFQFSIDPEKDASYSGTQHQLDQYLKVNVLNKIPKQTFKEYDLSAVTFTVSEDGNIMDANIFDDGIKTDKDQKVDQILLDAICNMPKWTPAEYTSGKKVKQEFAFTVGNMESCIINLLNVRRLPAE